MMASRSKMAAQEEELAGLCMALFEL